MTIDEVILALVREEITRLVRPEALNDSAVPPDDAALREQARAAAARLRRARRGGGTP